MQFKGIKSAKEYIESEYGLAHLIDIMRFEDTTSMLDIMQEFSDYNLNAIKAYGMLKMLKTYLDDLKNIVPQSEARDNRIKQVEELIKEATEI